MTISDVFAAAGPAAEAETSPAAAPNAEVRPRARARGYQSLPVTRWIGWCATFGRAVWADLRSAWWTPTSLPTVRQAWHERLPDRDQVPGDNVVLYRGWVAYNHTLGLAVPALAAAVVGVLIPIVWAARHPARFVLTAVIVTACTALIFH